VIFLDRSGDRKQDPFVEGKVALFTVGAVLGLAGVFMELEWVVWVGIGALGAGMVLRLISDRHRRGAVEGEEE